MVSDTGPTIAVSTFPLSALRLVGGRLDPAEVRAGLRMVKRCGASYLDITDTWLPVSELTDTDLEIVRLALAELDLMPCGVSVVRRSVVDPMQSQANYKHALRALTAARFLGAPVVSIGFHEPLLPNAQGVPFWATETPTSHRKDAVPLVRDLAREAAAMGIAIALELYEGGPVGSGRLAVDMVRRIGAPNVGINLDVGNIYRSPMSTTETWQECVRTCLPVTNFWHAKNYRRIHEYPTGRHVGSIATMLGEGDIDYRLCMAMAREVGYRGPVIIEHYGGDGLEAQRSGVRYLEDVLESQVQTKEAT